MLEKGCNPKLPVATLEKYLADINPTASRFILLIYKVSNHTNKSITDAFEYAKQKWYKSHKILQFQVGDLILVLTLNFNNIKGQRKLKDSLSGLFIIEYLDEKNWLQVELSG
ncbi:hypothetical protein O181_003655 [Austropuccinia psidii MF-1]|uniref:Uncharacterized protein n=1 Tax=Austropuccinia psidii MF-1 TaxID=1389203 RepID=A0A9Q3BEU7_9BASI|nr:hypothetical protein [Austropuccinia psidii MF-1]